MDEQQGTESIGRRVIRGIALGLVALAIFAAVAPFVFRIWSPYKQAGAMVSPNGEYQVILSVAKDIRAPEVRARVTGVRGGAREYWEMTMTPEQAGGSYAAISWNDSGDIATLSLYNGAEYEDVVLVNFCDGITFQAVEGG